jgi:hypothetical protein
MELNEADFSHPDANFKVKFQVVNGMLEIIPVNSEEIDNPVIPEEEDDVLGDFEDEKGNGGSRAVVKGKSTESGGVNTADSSKIILYVKILCLAAVILLIVLITRAESRKDGE